MVASCVLAAELSHRPTECSPLYHCMQHQMSLSSVPGTERSTRFVSHRHQCWPIQCCHDIYSYSVCLGQIPTSKWVQVLSYTCTLLATINVHMGGKAHILFCYGNVFGFILRCAPLQNGLQCTCILSNIIYMTLYKTHYIHGIPLLNYSHCLVNRYV